MDQVQLPDVTRPDVALVTISTEYAAGPQDEAVADALAAWADPPDGLVSATVFASADGEVVLTYAQWADDSVRDVGGVRYRVARSTSGAGAPGCVITAGFDVDGPERQRHVVGAVVDAAVAAGPLSGAVSAHFHLSEDGTRVLNYAEWVSPEAHERAMREAVLDEIHRVSLETPGVRPLRGRVHLARGVVRP
ncbi:MULTISPECIES: antibiotic biosynthesis monooxygenase [Actinosynnema]|uniref:antibiotic biosynthesis monooxygenase n=1 Tax=Actinosynnema TaxID=40566 RepID=UPI0020A26538|nr:antibiotic biosynthesis monooxygenase [Actinosynnema pretiosum]MCP2095616.1 Antibiotic biosynthesis monooxygenase [Actinosynnema pretiosum]